MKIRFALTTVCLMAVAVLSSPQVANAQCTIASLNGVYGFERVGVAVGNFNPAYSIGSIQIFASVGQFVADGAGHFTSLTQSISVNGTVYRNDQVFAPLARSFTVNTDCTGSLTIRSGILATAVNYDFVFEANNKVLRFVGSDNPTESFGTAIFEGPSTAVCAAGTAALIGPFGGHSFGVFVTPTFNNNAFLQIISAEGRFVFDGVGGLSYSDVTASNTLAITRGASSNRGKYTVDPLTCTGSTFTPGVVFGGAYPNFDFVLVAGNSTLLTLNTDNNLISAAIGEMTLQ